MNLYREFDDGRYYTYGDPGELHIWRHTDDDSKPLRCDCGGRGFRILQPHGSYETIAECIDCGTRDVVHSG